MKRQTFTLKLAALLVAVSTVLNLHAVNTITYTATYDLSKTTMGTDTLGGVTYTTVHYDGLYNHGDPGMPSLPVDYIRFSVPWNATNFRVSATALNNHITNITHLVYPCQPARMMCDTTPVTVTPPDLTAYAAYPQQRAWVVDEGFLAGENHIVTVAVMPVSYAYRKTGAISLNQLKASQQVRLTLRYDLSESLAMYPIVREDTALRAEGYRLTQSMVINPTNVQAYAPTDMMLDSLEFIIPNSGDGLNGGPLTPPDSTDISNDSIFPSGPAQIWPPYLIITTPNLLHSMRRLAALKSQKGYDVQVVTITDVLNSPYAGEGDKVNNVLTYTDEAGKLRQYLRHYYQSFRGDYVLLAGNGIPYRSYMFPMNENGDSLHLDSDSYFSDFNSNWFTGSFDKNHELYIGRIIAKKASQITNYTDKLFRYELNPGNGSTDYLRRALYTESVDMLGYSDNILKQTLGNIFSVDSVIKESAWNKYPKGADIIREINENPCGFLSFQNHGGPSSITVYGFNSNSNPEAYDNHINWIWALNSYHENSSAYKYCDTIGNALDLIGNKWMPNILYTIACKTIPYDTIPEYENIPMNVGESFTTGKDYGGPVFIGNTDGGFGYFSALLENAFGQELLDRSFIIGKANALAKSNYNIGFRVHQFTCALQNLLGDPSLEIWTDIPQQYSNISVTRSDSTISISGISADSTIVAIYNNRGIIKKRIAHTSNVSYSADPNSTIMLYKHNYIPFIAPLILQNTNLAKNQYVIASDVTAGNSIDSVRTSGDVTVKSGIEYEIEASGTVTLHDGFKVERGATFAVYPSCF